MVGASRIEKPRSFDNAMARASDMSMTLDTIAATMRKNTDEMLRSNPDGAHAATITMWTSFRRLKCQIYEQFWAKANPEQPRFPFESVEMKSGPLDGGGSWHGMKHRPSGKCYGVVR